MPAEGTGRHLAAIMFTDVAGYTALMQQDEEAARVARLRHREAVTAAVADHGGKLIQFLGDGSLSIFPSAVEAVTAGIRIQQQLLEEPVLPLRVGIHQGEIAYDDQGVYGDAVNVASRIENLGVAGSVLISEKVFDEIKNHSALSASLLGDVPLKNVARPVRVYAVHGERVVVPALDELTIGGAAAAPRVEGAAAGWPQAWSIKELLRRRVPQLLLGYLLVSWVLVEVLQSLSGQYGFSAGWAHGATVLLVSWVPSVLLIAYFHGGPGKRALTRLERIGVPVNVALSIAALLIVFRSTAPAAPTVPVGTAPSSTAEEPSAAAPSIVAVFPFEVAGANDVEFLRAALVSRISRNLGDTGELRTVDHRDVLGYLQAHAAEGPLTPAYAAAVAGYFGAHHMVMLEAFEAGGHFRVTVDLFDAEDPTTSGYTREAEGSADQWVEIANALSIGILEHLGTGAVQLSGPGTSSMEAMRALVQGDSEMRAGRYSPAVDAYRQAVAIDSTFAEAWFRLSLAAEFDFQFILAKAASRRALNYAGLLSDRERQLVHGWDAFLNGDVEEAEDLYHHVLRIWPEDREAQYGLGEVLFHFNPIRGRERGEAERLFRQVIAVDPNRGEVRYRLMEFATEQGESAWFDSLAAGIDPQADQAPVWLAVRAFVWGGDEDRRGALADLRNADPLTIGLAAGRIASVGHDFRGAEEVARLLADPGHGDDWEALGLLIAAQSSLAGGRWTRARQYFQEARELEFDWSLELEALYWSLREISSPEAVTDLGGPGIRDPQRAVDGDTLRALLESWDPAGAGTDFPYLAIHNARHGVIRDYVAGLVALETDSSRAETFARGLETARGTDPTRALARSLGRSLRARMAWRGGDAATALSRLERNETQATAEEQTLSPFFALAHDRYLRAELLRELERFDEALAWYRSLTAGYDFAYAALAYLGEARALEALGRDSLSAVAYRRFAELWSDADPAGRAMAEAAAEQAAQLEAGPEMPTPPRADS